MGLKTSKYASMLPVTVSSGRYSRQWLISDIIAGILAAFLFIPQSVAYAILAGLPAQVGLYASILPAIFYALLGTSRTLAIGPVAVTALLVANALVSVPETDYVASALLLSLLCGGLLIVMAVLRLDVLVNFISYSVLTGFTSAAAVLIIISQTNNLLGIPASQGNAVALIYHYAHQISNTHLLTLGIGVTIICLLWLMPKLLNAFIRKLDIQSPYAATVLRISPIVILVLTGVLVAAFNLSSRGLAIVENVTPGLPSLQWQFFSLQRAQQLLPAALIIALVSYVSSISVAKAMAQRRREKINNNQELVALGVANIAASFSGAMPVAGGFSRTTVNIAAGAHSQAASLVAGLVTALIAVFFTPLFSFLPKVALSAIIITSVIGLVNWRNLLETWRYDRSDTLAFVATFFGVLLVGIEFGLVLGTAIALSSFVWRSSRPHVAVVGRLPGSQHFRNIQRFNVETWPELLLLRVDRSLFFANVSYIEDLVSERAAANPGLKHLVIICSAINSIDFSAVETLKTLTQNLQRAGITLHLAEVKGPVMDRLALVDIENWLAPGSIFLSTEDAVNTLTKPSSS